MVAKVVATATGEPAIASWQSGIAQFLVADGAGRGFRSMPLSCEFAQGMWFQMHLYVRISLC